MINAVQSRASRRRREPLIVLLGFPEYYARFGFRPARDFGIGPDTPAAMAYALKPDITGYAGTTIPH